MEGARKRQQRHLLVVLLACFVPCFIFLLRLFCSSFPYFPSRPTFYAGIFFLLSSYSSFFFHACCSYYLFLFSMFDDLLSSLSDLLASRFSFFITPVCFFRLFSFVFLLFSWSGLLLLLQSCNLVPDIMLAFRLLGIIHLVNCGCLFVCLFVCFFLLIILRRMGKKKNFSSPHFRVFSYASSVSI